MKTGEEWKGNLLKESLVVVSLFSLQLEVRTAHNSLSFSGSLVSSGRDATQPKYQKPSFVLRETVNEQKRKGK